MTQEELLRQQQEKLAGIQQQQQAQQVPPQSFAEGKQAANSQTGAVSAQPAAVPVTPQPANYNLFARDKGTNYPQGAQGTPQTTLISQPTNTETQPAGQTAQAITVPGKSKDNTTKPIASTEDLAAAMGYTSPEDEERMRRASIANRRILAVGDALRHIGNIANTVNYAPAQQLNMPVLEEQARYEKGKAIRDAANYKYYTYQQAKAAQDAKAKQLNADLEYKQGLLQHYKDQEERLKKKDEFDRENKEAKRDLDREKFEADKAFKEGKLSVAQYTAQTARIRAVKSGRAGGGGGGKYWAYDQEGNIHYYPNRTMWEQGIYQFSGGMPQTETLTSTNASGEQTRRQVGRKPTRTGGDLARNANGGGTYSSFSIHKK